MFRSWSSEGQHSLSIHHVHWRKGKIGFKIYYDCHCHRSEDQECKVNPMETKNTEDGALPLSSSNFGNNNILTLQIVGLRFREFQWLTHHHELMSIFDGKRLH